MRIDRGNDEPQLYGRRGVTIPIPRSPYPTGVGP